MNNALLAAWERIEALGGFGVCDGELVVVCFKEVSMSDDDLEVFRNFPIVQMLSITDVALTDKALAHIEHITALEKLTLIGTQITKEAVADFQRRHPSIRIDTERPSTRGVNPFTGKPMQS